MKALILTALAATAAVAIVNPEIIASGLIAATTAIYDAAISIASRSVR